MQEVDIDTLKGVPLFREKKSYQLLVNFLVVTKFYCKDIVTAKRQCKNLLHSPHEIISTVCDFPYKIIEKCFQ